MAIYANYTKEVKETAKRLLPHDTELHSLLEENALEAEKRISDLFMDLGKNLVNQAVRCIVVTDSA